MFINFPVNRSPSPSGHVSHSTCPAGPAGIAEKVGNAWHSVKETLARTYKNSKDRAFAIWNAIQHPNYQEINACLRTCEMWLNVFGNIPGPSILSSQVRQLLGVSEIIAGLSFAVFHQVSACFASSEELEERYLQHADIDMRYCGHGIVNLFRAHLEETMLVALFVARICYDAWGIRFKYPNILSCSRPSLPRN